MHDARLCFRKPGWNLCTSTARGLTTAQYWLAAGRAQVPPAARWSWSGYWASPPTTVCRTSKWTAQPTPTPSTLCWITWCAWCWRKPTRTASCRTPSNRKAPGWRRTRQSSSVLRVATRELWLHRGLCPLFRLMAGDHGQRQWRSDHLNESDISLCCCLMNNLNVRQAPSRNSREKWWWCVWGKWGHWDEQAVFGK